jgi:hypothetical protein
MLTVVSTCICLRTGMYRRYHPNGEGSIVSSEATQFETLTKLPGYLYFKILGMVSGSRIPDKIEGGDR